MVIDLAFDLIIRGPHDNDVSYIHKLRILLQLWMGRAIKSIDCSELLVCDLLTYLLRRHSYMLQFQTEYFIHFIDCDCTGVTLNIPSIATQRLTTLGYECVNN